SRRGLESDGRRKGQRPQRGGQSPSKPATKAPFPQVTFALPSRARCVSRRDGSHPSMKVVEAACERSKEMIFTLLGFSPTDSANASPTSRRENCLDEKEPSRTALCSTAYSAGPPTA